MAEESLSQLLHRTTLGNGDMRCPVCEKYVHEDTLYEVVICEDGTADIYHGHCLTLGVHNWELHYPFSTHRYRV